MKGANNFGGKLNASIGALKEIRNIQKNGNAAINAQNSINPTLNDLNGFGTCILAILLFAHDIHYGQSPQVIDLVKPNSSSMESKTN